MTSPERQRQDQARAFGSLGLSTLAHGVALGALALAGGLFVVERATAPRQLTFEAPRLSELVEEALPEDLTEVAPDEQLEELVDPTLEPVTFADSWVEAPDPDPELPGDAALEVTPADRWSDRVLRERADYRVPERPVPEEAVALAPVEPPPVVEPQPAPAEPEVAPTPAGPLPAPARLEGRDPDYPKTSLRRREQGDVTLRLELDEAGRVVLVELSESSGHRRLDEAVMAVAPLWRFDVSGLAADDRARGFLHTVHFRLTR